MWRQALVFALCLLSAFVVSQWDLDRFLTAEAGVDLAHVQQGRSRIAFEFDSLRDLISEGAVGADQVRLDAGLLRARLPQGRANLRFNFRGLTLDARRYQNLSLRIKVSAPTQLMLIFDEPGELEENLVRFDLVAGWNELALSLADLTWRRAREMLTAIPIATEVWGGTGRRVGEFRAYLSGPANVAIALDHLRFLERPGAASTDALAKVEWISVEAARLRLKSAVPEPAPTQHTGVLLPLWTDTPERILSLRDQMRERDAETLFWPASRDLPADATALPVRSLNGWSAPWWLVALLASAMLATRLLMRADTPRKAGLDLMLGLGPLVVLTVGLGIGERPTASAFAVLLLSLIYMCSRLEGHALNWRAGAAAWRRPLFPSVAIGLLILAVGFGSAHPAHTEGERAVLYLPFVVLQQALLLGFLLARAKQLAPASAAAVAAGLFALPHAPNFALMIGSAAAAWLWCSAFLIDRAPLPVLVSHFLLGMLSVSVLPPQILYSAESSLRFFLVH